MKIKNLHYFIFTVFIAAGVFQLTACDENLLQTEVVCSEEPNFPFETTEFDFKIITDIETNTIVYVNQRGFLYSDSIVVSKNGLIKTAKIGGHFCKDLKFSVDIIYTDTTDISRLRIEGSSVSNLITGKLLYCANINNNCEFTQIGQLSGSSSGYNFFVNFTSPLFSGFCSAVQKPNPNR